MAYSETPKILAEADDLQFHADADQISKPALFCIGKLIMHWKIEKEVNTGIGPVRIFFLRNFYFNVCYGNVLMVISRFLTLMKKLST